MNTIKPSAVYKNRMQRYTDDVWLIWSNKNGCWYRDNSQGYTSDISQAGLYSREEAARHMSAPDTPRKYRNTEPFPLSSVRAMLIRQREAIVMDAMQRVSRINAALSGRLDA